MSIINKICFAYPVKYREGMSIEDSIKPNELFYSLPAGSTHKMSVVIGLMVTIQETVFINVNVKRVGDQQETDEDKVSDGAYQNLRSHVLEPGQGMFLTALLLDDVLFDASGMYEIKVKLHPADENKKKSSKVLDSYSSYFYALTKDGE